MINLSCDGMDSAIDLCGENGGGGNGEAICTVVIFAISIAHSSQLTVNPGRWPGFFVAILAVAAVATRFFVAAVLLRDLRAIAIATAHTICKTHFHLYRDYAVIRE